MAGICVYVPVWCSVVHGASHSQAVKQISWRLRQAQHYLPSVATSVSYLLSTSQSDAACIATRTTLTTSDL